MKHPKFYCNKNQVFDDLILLTLSVFYRKKSPSLVVKNMKVVMDSYVDQKHFTLNLADNNISDFIPTTLINAVHQNCLPFLQKLNISNNQLDTISEDLFNVRFFYFFLLFVFLVDCFGE